MKKGVSLIIFIFASALLLTSLASATNCYNNYYPYHSAQYYYPTNYNYIDTTHLNPYLYPHYNPHFIYEPVYSFRFFVNPWRAWW